jgi:2-methylcitrate dehydratase PrpD
LQRHIDEFMAMNWDDLPKDVQHMAARCLLDLCATLVAGRATLLSDIIYEITTATYGGDNSTLLLDGRRVSAPGAALASATTIDAMDIHDGYRSAKGHAGVNVFPAALAVGEMVGWDGQQFMAALVKGYEIALRAGRALHQTACDYHTSGAWGAIAAAAVTAQALDLSPEQTRHALGIAEYHGPRSQMMRCIDHPTMLKDGSGWGCMAGVMAGLLAQRNFTGAPALTVESEAVAQEWQNLGATWLMRDLYFKPYACCRWAQPAVEAARALTKAHQIQTHAIDRITVHTFEAATHLNVTRPQNTEEAQYSLPYPVAAALVHQQLDPIHVQEPFLSDAMTLDLAARLELRVDQDLEDRFPNEALAYVTLVLDDGQHLTSEIHGAKGDPDDPLDDSQLNKKFSRICIRLLSADRTEQLRDMCWKCNHLDSITELVDLLRGPLNTNPSVEQ